MYLCKKKGGGEGISKYKLQGKFMFQLVSNFEIFGELMVQLYKTLVYLKNLKVGEIQDSKFKI